MQEKLILIKSIFSQSLEEDAPNDSPPNAPIQQGKYHGGVYNSRKYMYSEAMIQILPIDKLETIIKKQIGFVAT